MGGMGGGALGNLTQLGNMSVGYGISKAQMGDQFNYWKKSLKRGPQYRARGLERAGINRIIAAGGGIEASSAGGAVKANSVGTGGPGAGNPNVDQASAASMSAQADVASSQADLNRANQHEVNLRNEFLSTDEGKRYIRSGYINKATPNNAAGILSKGLREVGPIIGPMFQSGVGDAVKSISNPAFRRGPPSGTVDEMIKLQKARKKR